MQPLDDEDATPLTSPFAAQRAIANRTAAMQRKLEELERLVRVIRMSVFCVLLIELTRAFVPLVHAWLASGR